MCQSSVYMGEEGNEELVFEEVDSLEAEEGEVRLVNLFGEEKRLKARIRKFSLVDHKIFLEALN